MRVDFWVEKEFGYFLIVWAPTLSDRKVGRAFAAATSRLFGALYRHSLGKSTISGLYAQNDGEFEPFTVWVLEVEVLFLVPAEKPLRSSIEGSWR